MHIQDHLEIEADRNVRRALVTIMSFRLRAGASTSELRSLVSECTNQAIREHKPAGSVNGIDIYLVASILRTWHLDAQFLTPEGNPRPLKTYGRRGLKELVSRHFPISQFQAVLTTMRTNGLVKMNRLGHWAPSERHARIPKPTTQLLSHFAEGIARLAETVAKNTTSRKKGDLLFERATKVSQLPVSEARAFKEYVQSQGIAFLTAVDDWLETRTARQPFHRKKTCSAGVFAFGFIDEPRSTTRIPGKSNSRKKPTRAA